MSNYNVDIIIRKILLGIRGQKDYHYPPLPKITISPEDVQDRIKAMLLADNPCMIARFESVSFRGYSRDDTAYIRE